MELQERDPVCGMFGRFATSNVAEHDGRTWRFCSEGCRERFVANPAFFVPKESPGPPKSSELPTAREGSGSAGTDEPKPELVDMTRRFRVSLALTIPTLALSMSDLLPGRPVERVLSPSVQTWIQLVLSTPVVVWAGWPFFVRSWASVVSRRPNMFTLIALGTGAAYLYSLIATLFPRGLPAAFRGRDGAVAVYFEAAAVITTLVLLGQVLELRARSQAGRAIPALLDLAPKLSRVGRPGGNEEDVPR